MHVPIVRLAKRQNVISMLGRHLAAIIFGYGLISLITDLHPFIAFTPMRLVLSSFQMDKVSPEIK